MDTFKPESLKHDRAFSLIQSVSKSNATGAHTFRLQSTLTELMNSGYIESVKQLRETLLIQEWGKEKCHNLAKDGKFCQRGCLIACPKQVLITCSIKVLTGGTKRLDRKG
eukprot:1141642-Pelagomonas_calceolata.AAC.3